MRILADGAGKLLEYIVYLGENNTSNFDIKKNTKHTMNLVIKGENEIDNRVTVYEGLYFGKANCYICTGSQVAFDVTPYRTSKNLTYTYSEYMLEPNMRRKGCFVVARYEELGSLRQY